MKAGKTVLSAIALACLTFTTCKKQTKITQEVSEEITTAPNISAAVAETITPLQVYGVWHAGNDYCIWGAERSLSEFDSKNHWLIDRGNGQPSVNIVILSFVHPLKLLNSTTDATTLNGVPRGMTPAIIDYFKSRGVRVMLSIGGITYTDAWDQALAANATQLGLRAATVANNLGVGIEIDYEQNRNPNLNGLQQFITAYRSQIPYDATGCALLQRIIKIVTLRNHFSIHQPKTSCEFRRCQGKNRRAILGFSIDMFLPVCNCCRSSWLACSNHCIRII